ncbi:hypothetical protein CJ305_18250 [Leeuwenhoekiella nanhaiensis]|uniref:Uncharacterized protein n=1 Tax=Leeuwenhoekiella nanhaiensis TaxID=1655491 RepID=A0A2G1VM13_9FLAO|nr:hypothetical protein CJ305_18250 [Leeuwenhoekiella nanhaiensis]
MYHGFDIIVSRLLSKANVIYVGINPVKGNGSSFQSVIIERKGTSYLDVLNEQYLKVIKPDRLKAGSLSLAE